jgi:hypothetical protein
LAKELGKELVKELGKGLVKKLGPGSGRQLEQELVWSFCLGFGQ